MARKAKAASLRIDANFVDASSSDHQELVHRDDASQLDVLSSVKLVDASQQTKEIEVRSSYVQQGGFHEVSIQTEATVFAKSSYDVSDEMLLPLLHNTIHLFEEALAENVNLRAYDDLDADSDGQPTAHSVYTLDVTHLLETKEIGGHNLTATSVSWNATGYAVAVSFGRHDAAQIGWCTDPGALCCWNLGRREVDNKEPEVTIYLENCLQVVAYHPRHPALIAGGTINGELYVWDLGRDGEKQIGRSNSTSDSCHREAITSVQWRYEATEVGRRQNQDETFQIITAGADGRVLVWLWHRASNPVLGFEVTHPLPNSSRANLWGVTALALSTRNTRAHLSVARTADYEGAFIVGTEGGAVFRCLLGYNASASERFISGATSDNEKWRSPVKQAYDMHVGPVYGVDTCPHRRGLFLTCGSDGMLRVYSRLSLRPVLEFEPSASELLTCQWSPARPCVIACGSGDGHVYLFDVSTTAAASSMHPLITIDVSHGSKSPVHAIAFNPHLSEYFAACERKCVHIYTLAPSLHKQRAREVAVLARIAETGLTETVSEEQDLVNRTMLAPSSTTYGDAPALADEPAEEDEYNDDFEGEDEDDE